MQQLPRIASVIASLLFAAVLTTCGFERPVFGDATAIEGTLRQRLVENPQDGNTWRLLGRMYLQRGEVDSAVTALERAVALVPESAAAAFDLGSALLKQNRAADAVPHLQSAIALAPESTYAAQANERLQELGVEPTGLVQTAGFEVKSFDGSERSDVTDEIPPLVIPERGRLSGQVAFGTVYNSNVALAPTSRELTPESPQGLQAFFSPDLELAVFRTPDWDAGVLLYGHFTLNEGNLREFNLQSYQPGLYVERMLVFGPTIVAPRLQYDFTHDEFEGVTFGNRHALTLSSVFSWSDLHSSYLGWVIDDANFADDGSFAPVTSKDGVSNTLTASHTLYLEQRWLRFLRGGVDWQNVDTDGSDFTFRGATLFAVAEVPLAERWTLNVRGSWGFRDYFRYEFDPPRDEDVYRAGARLRYDLTEQLAISGVFNYDRFDSENPLFAASRWIVGAEMSCDF